MKSRASSASSCSISTSTLEIAGTDADARLPGMRPHLEGCPACHEDYESLRDFSPALEVLDLRPEPLGRDARASLMPASSPGWLPR